MDSVSLSSFPSPEKIEGITGVKPSNIRTTEEYREVRNVLYSWLGNECYFCGQEHDQNNNLVLHHVNPEEGHDQSAIGGINHLRKIYKDIQEGMEVELVCSSCHNKLHHLLGDDPSWTAV